MQVSVRDRNFGISALCNTNVYWKNELSTPAYCYVRKLMLRLLVLWDITV